MRWKLNKRKTTQRNKQFHAKEEIDCKVKNSNYLYFSDPLVEMEISKGGVSANFLFL